MNSRSSRENLGPWTLHAFVLLGVSACLGDSPRLSVALVDSTGGAVEVHGLSASVARQLSAIPETDGRWARILSIRTADGMPAMAGSYSVTDSTIRFVPRFPPEGLPLLQVSLDRLGWREAGGGALSGDQTLWWEFELPGRPVAAPSTRVLAIHPSSPVLPANQLRWYVEFSAPMREGSALAHVRLRDQDGAVVEKAFLELDEELWDPTRTRLTLMFDMGRVKQGIQSRADLGPVLAAGRRYALEIDRNWIDAHGATLVKDTVHRFTAAADRHVALDPAQWRIGAIAAGKRDPLRVTFGFPLDHALAERMILVTSADGERVGGALRLVDHDRGLEFLPSQPWGAARYQLRVHPALEDVTGNRVGHAFDASLERGESAGVGGREVIVAIGVR
jgi:hypothetical protein